MWITRCAVIYARYSSDLQAAASIEDQIRICRERIERDGLLVQVYEDRAVSGATLIRPGIQAAERAPAETQLAKIKKRQRRNVDAIADSISARTLKDELMALEAREDVLIAKLQTAPQQNVLLNPNMAEIYRQRVAVLHQALDAPHGNVEAIEAVRSLIDRIAVTPTAGKLTMHKPRLLLAPAVDTILTARSPPFFAWRPVKRPPTFPFQSLSN
jgi:hypothetical protein